MVYNKTQKACIDISDCEEYQRINQIYEYVVEELLANMSNFDTVTIEDIYAFYSYIVNNGYLRAKRDMCHVKNKVMYEVKY